MDYKNNARRSKPRLKTQKKTNNFIQGQSFQSIVKLLKQPMSIGFMKELPVGHIYKSFEVVTYCRNFPVKITVNLVKLTFRENAEYGCTGLVTEKVSISERLPLNGFNSYCHIDEAIAMRKAIAFICNKLNVSICNEINTWPFCKVTLFEYTEDILTRAGVKAP